MPQPYEWIIFDFGRVLAELHTEAMIESIELALGLTRGGLQPLLPGKLEAFVTGKLEEQAFFEYLCSRSPQSPTADVLRAALNRELGNAITGSVELVRQLAGKKKLAILSNTNQTHWRHVEQTHDFLGLFDEIVVSHVAGLRKPDAAIYMHAVRRFKTEPHKCLFIDDLEENVREARAAGWDAFQFLNPEQCRSEFLTRGLISA